LRSIRTQALHLTQKGTNETVNRRGRIIPPRPFTLSRITGKKERLEMIFIRLYRIFDVVSVKGLSGRTGVIGSTGATGEPGVWIDSSAYNATFDDCLGRRGELHQLIS